MKRIIAVVLVGAATLATTGCTGRDLREARQKIERICASRGGSVNYDVQGQNLLVYACNDDRVLKTISY